MVDYIISNRAEIAVLILHHTVMTVLAVGTALVIGVPAGIALARRRILGEVVIYFSSIIFCIPAVALFGFFMPVLSHFGHGIGAVPAITAVIIYCLLPIIRNTYSGMLSIPPEIYEASRAMGMSSRERLFRVDLPICMPNVTAGIKISAVLAAAALTLGAYIGAGGLGLMIIRGISQSDYTQIVTGSILVTCFALGLEYLIIVIEKIVRFLFFSIRKF